MSVIFIFESLHKLIKADNLLKEKSVKVRVIPVPTSYHSTCGMCLQSAEDDVDKIDNLLVINEMSFEKYAIM